jgi:S-(hydroxymethyl)glutathione dehydrogenase/alcohol dehydrogenase
VIVRTTAAVFCVTDCISQSGRLGKQLPVILGHAGVGVIEEVGEAVDEFQVGQRVAVPGTPECGACYWCVRARPDQCDQLFGRPQQLVGHLASGEPVTTAGVGTYAEKIKLPETSVFPLETDLPDDQLALLGCGVTSGLGAVFNIAEVEPGSSVAIVGCGHLGLWMTQGARVAGAERIVAVEPRPERRELAGRLGATHLVDPGEGDPVEQVRELTGGRGADFVLEASGSVDAMTQAFHMTRPAGTLVITGVQTLASVVSFPAVEFALRGRDIKSCQNGRVRMRRDLPRFVRMIEDGLVDPKPIITSRYSLDEINDAARASDAREDLSGVIVLA